MYVEQVFWGVLYCVQVDCIVIVIDYFDVEFGQVCVQVVEDVVGGDCMWWIVGVEGYQCLQVVECVF